MFFLDGTAINDLGGGWMVSGIVKILVIIATLQIVKKLPELINMIFGTNIKDRGGIKGRLGEMAGIGGIAQKAWTSLGAGARNLAKAGLMAPAAIGYKVADKKYFDKTGKKLSDNKLFRQAKGAGAGISSLWKTGNPLKAYEAYDKGTAAPNYTAAERIKAQNIRNKQMIDKVNNAIGYEIKGPNGQKTKFNLLDENGNWNNQFKDPVTGKDVFVPESVMNQAKEMYYKELEKQGEAGKLAAAKMRAQDNQMQAEGLKKKTEDARKFFEAAASTFDENNNAADANFVRQIVGKIRDGKGLSEQDRQQLETLASNNQNVKDGLAQVTKFENEAITLRNRIPGFDGNTGDIALGTFITQQKNTAEGLGLKYDQAITTLSEVDKSYLTSLQGVISSSNPIINGALQNNASIMSIKDEPLVINGQLQLNDDGTTKMKYTDLKYDENAAPGQKWTANVVQNGQVVNVTLDPDTEISPVITNYVASIKSGEAKTSYTDYGIDVVEFNRLVDQVTNSGHKAGTKTYYDELHNLIKQKYQNNQQVINNVNILEQSGFLPQ